MRNSGRAVPDFLDMILLDLIQDPTGLPTFSESEDLL